MKKRITSVLLLGIAAALVVGIGLKPGLAEDEAGDKAKDAPQGKADISVIADPSHEKMNLTAPDTFKALFKTTQGEFTIEVDRSWAPNGADRFYSLVKNGYYDGTRFFRVVEDFVVQWGIHGNPEVNKAWYDPDNAEAVNLKDDKRQKSNAAGTVVFANAGPNTRSTQLFINLGDNDFLDNQARVGSIFAPFGRVDAEGMKVVRKLYDGYGEPPRQLQGLLAEKGNAVLDEYFPKMDAIESATIVQDEAKEDDGE